MVITSKHPDICREFLIFAKLNMYTMIIAIDFDGTIVEHQYPKIGKELPFATDTIKLLQRDGHQIILWTFRYGKELEEAVEFCRKKGLEFYAVNKSYPEEKYDASVSRKIHADLFIDDRNLGGLPDWGAIYQTISGKTTDTESKRKKSVFRFFK